MPCSPAHEHEGEDTQDAVAERDRHPLVGEDELHREQSEDQPRAPEREAQIQQQNQAYERRIEELNRQLLVAKEENRELIRIRIAQIKMEMEQARVRLLAQEENEGVEG